MGTDKGKGIMHKGGSSVSARKRRGEGAGTSTASQGHGRNHGHTTGTGGSIGRLSIGSGSMKNFFPTCTVASAQPEIHTTMCSKDIVDTANDTIGRWFYDASIPFSATNSYHFRPIADVITYVGRQSKMPTYHKLHGKMLNNAVRNVKACGDELQLSWKDTRSSVMANGWTNIKNRTLVKFLECFPLGAMFLKYIDFRENSKVEKKVFSWPHGNDETLSDDNHDISYVQRHPAQPPPSCVPPPDLVVPPSGSVFPPPLSVFSCRSVFPPPWVASGSAASPAILRCCLIPPTIASCPTPLPLSRRRRLFVPVPLVVACLFVMAEEMGPKNDVVLDAGSASKTENVPIQVTSIRLTKDNYLSWFAALEIETTSRGRLSYITGDKPAPSKSDPQWATWALEDSQVKVWIISSVSSDIQPLILRKPTSFDMWTVLAKMYGRKKKHLRTYQIKRSIYSLKQGDLSVAAFYAALKTKWEELDYHVNDEWNWRSDHSLYWEKEWMDRTFLFLGGLRDEFESIRSQILNGDEIPGIEEVYARVESEEQRRQVMHLDTGHGPSAFVSRASGTGQRPEWRCTHCNKLGHSVDFCWDIHPEKRLVRGRPPSGRRSSSVSDSSQSNSSSGTKSKLSPDQLKELQAYISQIRAND
ncbi:hypothetical protein EJ110_NYTH42624 [Nymphaea thermarum]|nr:hypothetical protein EJ110_NYTH42624 [Nymphaea thermarum]